MLSSRRHFIDSLICSTYWITFSSQIYSLDSFKRLKYFKRLHGSIS